MDKNQLYLCITAMARKSPYEINLSDTERKILQDVAAKYTLPYRDVIRAKIILYAEKGLSNKDIATKIDTPRQIVSKWRKRFYENGLDGLNEMDRPGRPSDDFD